MEDSKLRDLVEGPELQRYLGRFEARYLAETSFREIVHRYLAIDRSKRLSLATSRMIAPARYRREVKAMIGQYTERIIEDLKKVEGLEETVEALDAIHEKAKGLQDELQSSNLELQAARHALAKEETEDQRAVVLLEAEIESETVRIESETAQALDELDVDPVEMIKDHLKSHIQQSEMFATNAEGEMSWSDDAMVQRLEHLCLQELIKDVERTEGNAGFLGRIRRSYEGVIASYDDIEDLSELHRVDWMRSIILSRTRGYQTPQYPYLVAAKVADNATAAVDTAIALDTSESMRLKGRFECAKRTCLALNALMRELNPNNKTYLAHFNAELEEIDSKQLIKTVKPIRTTRTDLALQWLVEKLASSEAALAYLITDGRPFGISNIRGLTNEAAALFKLYPHVKLRVFLVDVNAITERTMKEIGKHAGDETRVVTVDAERLGYGILTDVASCFSEMVQVGSS